MGIFQGLAGNMQQINPQEAQREYGPWLLEQEQIQSAYKMLRDGFCITNNRIITIDHQGATGKKARVRSIPLHAIVDVTAETAGTLDDSEITLTYITTPRLRSNVVEYASYTFEFPRNFDVAALYRFFMSGAMSNVARLNES